LFRNCWANPLCSPTRALIQTGRYALRTGISNIVGWVGTSPTLSYKETSLPELLDLAQSGYAHAAIGKWHLSKQFQGLRAPNWMGWSHYAGSVANPSGYINWARTVDGVTTNSPNYMTSQNVDDALEWIQNQSQPWVCYLALFSPHAPFHEPPANLHTQNLAGKSPSVDPIPFFKAMVEAMDTEIGRLFTQLGPSVMARTNVVFLGDNGTDWRVTEPPFIRQHGKGTVYEGGLNVPLIVAGPAVGSPDREEASLVSAVDVYSTVAHLCGVDRTPPFVKIDGISFVPLLAAPNQPPTRTTVYAELAFVSAPGPVAIRDARYKLIRRFEATPVTDELFDLVADPFEQSDLLQTASLTPGQQSAYDWLRDEVVSILDTSGRFVGFGHTGCVGSNGRPEIGWQGTPAIGSSYTVSLSGAAPDQPAVMRLGASNKVWNGLALPYSMEELGSGPQCTIFTSSESHFPVRTSSQGTAAWTINLPPQTELIGGSVYHTWLIVDPAAPNNPLGLTASNAVEVIIGATVN
jgi:arylsulfatase A-like enzyme